ncbi:MAG: hypothetical protein V4675_09870, partial [Verrucomicrobiota bacterium]
MESFSGLLGTKEAVTSKECWKIYLNSMLADGVLDVEELQESLMGLVGQMASSDTPWALCADCVGAVKKAGISPRLNLSELPLHGHALCEIPEPMVFVLLDDAAMISAHKAAAAAVNEIVLESASGTDATQEGSVNDSIEDDEYMLSAGDRPLLLSAQAFLEKAIYGRLASPAEVISIAKLLHALQRLPKTTSDVNVQVSITSPRRGFGDIKTFHWWRVELEYGSLRLQSGGHFHRPSTGGDAFRTMSWEACPGSPADLFDYRHTLRVVPDVRSFEDGVASIDFATGEYTIEVIDDDNPLLEEMEGGEDDFATEVQDNDDSAEQGLQRSDEAGIEGDEADDSAGDDEDESESAEFALVPVGEAEMMLALEIDREEVISHPPDFGCNVDYCDLCRRDFNRCGLYVDGKLRGDISWANMCAACFATRGEGIGACRKKHQSSRTHENRNA